MQTLIIVLYTLSLTVIFLYSLAQLNLLFNYLKAKKKTDNAPVYDLDNPDEIPFVTIQLPLYNELYVVKRLLDNISKMDYPTNKMEIQVLDDSTDESLTETRKLINNLRLDGLPIKHITRTNYYQKNMI